MSDWFEYLMEVKELVQERTGRTAHKLDWYVDQHIVDIQSCYEHNYSPESCYKEVFLVESK